jgi:hypothetical protein
MPLTVGAVTDPAVVDTVRAAYERRFVLVRPDGHVAWRGDQLPDDPGNVLDVVEARRRRRPRPTPLQSASRSTAADATAAAPHGQVGEDGAGTSRNQPSGARFRTCTCRGCDPLLHQRHRHSPIAAATAACWNDVAVGHSLVSESDFGGHARWDVDRVRHGLQENIARRHDPE